MTLTIKSALGLAALQIGAALAATAAARLGWISQDQATRVAMAVIGLALAIMANGIPKAVDGRTADGQAIKRVTGWSLVLAGLAHAALWLLAPMEIANLASMAAVLAAMAWVGVYGYRRWRRSKAG